MIDARRSRRVGIATSGCYSCRMGLHPNYRYCLARARSIGGRVLDFGCGGGQTVRAGLAEGLDIYGADVFFEPSPEYLESVSDLLGRHVFQIGEDGRLPFPDAHFDCVVSNQVFEHVPDLGAALTEIRRVLCPGGVLLTMFPTAEVWREGHSGVPFAHRLLRFPRVFRLYMSAAYRIGMGNHRSSHDGRRGWVKDFERYLTDFTFYRRYRDIVALMAANTLTLAHEEVDYMRFRWGRQIMPAFLFRRLGGEVLVARAH